MAPSRSFAHGPLLARRALVSVSLASSVLGPSRCLGIEKRCESEIQIVGAYLQACQSDQFRDFDFPSPAGKLRIEQGSVGPGTTGAAVWNAGALLAEYMATQLGENYFANKSVIELGCGAGLAGITAARLGARSVVLTDGSAEILARAGRNAANNPSTSQISTRRLLWGDVLDTELAGSFDIVLGADVLYLSANWLPFAKTARELLSSSGELLVAETGHELLSVPAAMGGFRVVAEGCGLRIGPSEELPLLTNGYPAELLTARSTG